MLLDLHGCKAETEIWLNISWKSWALLLGITIQFSSVFVLSCATQVVLKRKQNV